MIDDVERVDDIQRVIYDMLTESTGTHMLDSGGAAGRHWQRNQKRRFIDFRDEPEATLILEPKGYDAEISVFHFLTAGALDLRGEPLELDDLAVEFNALGCDVWNGDYYGTSAEQCEWLDRRGFKAINDGWNTYNWDSILSQTLQGTTLENRNGDRYELLQIHNGCDVRGGYTDARLFRSSEYCDFPSENVFFSVPGHDDIEEASYFDDMVAVFYQSGQWINNEGLSADDDDWAALRERAAQIPGSDNKVIHGSIDHQP